MRVLVVTHSTQLLGGTESYLRELLPRLAGEGLEVGLAAEGGTHVQNDVVQAQEARWNWQVSNADQGKSKLVSDWNPDVIMQKWSQ